MKNTSTICYQCELPLELETEIHLISGKRLMDASKHGFYLRKSNPVEQKKKGIFFKSFFNICESCYIKMRPFLEKE